MKKILSKEEIGADLCDFCMHKEMHCSGSFDSEEIFKKMSANSRYCEETYKDFVNEHERLFGDK